MNNGFGVGPIPIAMTSLLEGWTQVCVVENLTVIYEPERSVFIAHRLVPARKVHDTKPAVTQKCAAVIEIPEIVRSTMADGVGHLFHDTTAVQRGRLGDKPGDSAHGCFSVRRIRLTAPDPDNRWDPFEHH